MTDAPLGEGPDSTVKHSGTRRKRVVVLLVVLGVAALVGGVVTALVAKASIDHASSMSSYMPTLPVPTLPVHTYTQYTNRLVVPDYASLSIGIILALVGAMVLIFGTVVAFARPRVA